MHNRYDFLDGGSARRKAATYTMDNTNTNIHVSSGIRTHDLSVLVRTKTIHALNHAATQIYIYIYIYIYI
jgi:hypothetical protein